MSDSMRVVELWRHPVKSFQGEPVDHAVVEVDGVSGDRVWGVRDEATGRILTGRREPRLLLASARLVAGEPQLELPTGETCHGAGAATDRALSDWLGAPATLAPAENHPPASAEYFADATDDTSAAIEWSMPAGRFVDAMPALLLTTASLAVGAARRPAGDWGVRRFRPNVLIEASGESWLEDSWCGRTVAVGEVEFEVRQPCVRCTMVTRPQPELTRDLEIYKTLARHHGGTFGVWASVRTPGTIRLGDRVEVIVGTST